MLKEILDTINELPFHTRGYLPYQPYSNAITQGAFESLYQVPKIQNIAAYIFHAHIKDKYYMNFADCSVIARRCGARDYLFGKRTGNSNLVTFTATTTMMWAWKHIPNKLFPAVVMRFGQCSRLTLNKRLPLGTMKAMVLIRQVIIFIAAMQFWKKKKE